LTASITFKNIDVDIIERMREEAARRNVELDVIAREWLRRGAVSARSRVAPSDEDRQALLALAGTWTDEEADAFNAAVADFERIDEHMWN